MVALTRAMEFVTTASEVEALLLEANLIKRYRPTFNIVLRDDKSFPYIYLARDHDFPLIGKHRGAKRPEAEYFGPFASAGAVNDTLNALLKAFPLRSCRDSIFSTRTRPCLQYQIKRCSAPCVGRIGKEEYGRIVDEVREFLSGRSDEVQTRLQAEMQAASAELDFERAARPARPPQGDGPYPGPPGDQHRRGRRGGRDRRRTRKVARSACRCSSTAAGSNYGNRAYYPGAREGCGAGRDRRGVPRPVLRRTSPARLVLLAEPAGAGPAGRGVERARRPQGGAARAEAGREAPAGRARAGQRRAGAGATPAESGQPGAPARAGVAERFGLAARPAADRGLRQQPHPGQQRGRRDDRRRPGRLRRRAATASSTSRPASSRRATTTA